MAKKEQKAIGSAASGAISGTQIGGPGMGTAIGAGVGLLSGLFSGDDEDNSAEIARINALWDNLYAPTADDLAVNYEDFNYAGDIDPRQLTAEQLAMSDNLQNINLDPRLRNAQMNALETLGKIAGSGFTPDELASMESSRMQREADLSSRLKQLQQNQDMRGVGNSDMALAQKMMEAQGSANQGAADARAQEAEAYKRSLQAIMSQGDMAGKLENTDYTRAANIANALNNREMINLQQRAQTNTSNVDAFNRALESNRNLRQDTLNKTTASRNANMDANSNAKDRAFNMQYNKVAGQTGGINNQIGQNNTNQARNDNMWSNIISGGIKAGAGLLSDNKAQDNKTKAQAEAWGNDIFSNVKKYNGQP